MSAATMRRDDDRCECPARYDEAECHCLFVFRCAVCWRVVDVDEGGCGDALCAECWAVLRVSEYWSWPFEDCVEAP